MAQHLLTGSTTNGVAANASVPVVCVPATSDPGSAPTGRCRVDVSETSAVLVETAAAMAHDLGGRVLVMHA